MILVINPGSTSTKIAVFDGNKIIFQSAIHHSTAELARFENVNDQLPFRKKLILEQLKQENIDLSRIDIVIGRGGLIKPIPSGIYRVNTLMKKHLSKGLQGQHASNLGGLIADEIARICPKATAYIADPVVVDELQPCARVAGHPLFERKSIFHALNQKAVARLYAQTIGKAYEDLNLIIANLGGGISIGAHQHGRVIDVNQALDGEGPFSPERSGTLPANQLVKLCFSGEYSYNEIEKMLCGKGGLVAYFNVNNVGELVDKVQKDNDMQTAHILEAMCYQVSKEIGAMSVVLKGKIDQIILTGGIAFNEWVTSHICDYISFIAPITISPGEDEMAALASLVRDPNFQALEYT